MPDQIYCHLISFFRDNVPIEVVQGQARVMQHYGYDHQQIPIGDHVTHGGVLRDFTSAIKPNEMVLFLDIDCIPIKKNAVRDIIMDSFRSDGVVGVQQNVNIKAGVAHTADYVGPACMCFTHSAWLRAGEPDLSKWIVANNPGYRLTEAAKVNNVPVEFLKPVYCEIPKWKLLDGTDYGYGTYYEGDIFHSFESRHADGLGVRLFLLKCDEILGVTV